VISRDSALNARADLSSGFERLQSAIESEIVPRLLLSHRVGPIWPALAVAAVESLGEAEVELFVGCLRRMEEGPWEEYLRELIAAGVAAEVIYLDLLTPAARRLGVMWEEDDCDFVEVTIAVGRIQSALRSLGEHFHAGSTPAAAPPRILLTCLPGDHHTLGLIMVTEFFMRAGWDVALGHPMTSDDLASAVRHERFDVVGFSVACNDRVSTVRRRIREVRRHSRNRGVQVLVGGRVFADDAELCGQVGADAATADARSAPALARTLLQH
jgi:MerR family transcriptional regulator, light-induced transcriptional regulator